MDSNESYSIRPKSATVLKRQFDTVDQIISGRDADRQPHASINSFVPPSLQSRVLEIKADEWKQRFPKRYEALVSIIRQRRKLGLGLDNSTPLPQEALNNHDTAALNNWLGIMNNLDRYIENHHNDVDSRTLRDRQMDVFETIRDELEHGVTKGYIKLPTGTGKTVLFSEMLEAANVPSLIVVPTEILVLQTKEKLLKYASNLSVGMYYSDVKDFGKQVMITTYDSLQAYVHGAKDAGHALHPDRYQMVIYDEAHRGLSDLRQDIVNHFDHTLQLGFTATPDFNEEKTVEKTLNKKLYEMSIEEAVSENLLCPARNLVVKTQTDISQVRVSSGKYDEAQLSRTINTPERNQEAIDIYKSFISNLADQGSYPTAVSYCADVQHARDLADFFNRNGVSAAAIYGEMPANMRNNILERYKTGEIKVLCNDQLLIEGFDEPRASICLNLAPTRSKVVAEQRAGRVLRLDENNPDKMAYIIDFIPSHFDPKNPPILFADVVGTCELRNKEGKPMNMSERTDEVKNNIKRISSVEVFTDPEEVLAIGKPPKEKVNSFLPEIVKESELPGLLGLTGDELEIFKQRLNGGRIGDDTFSGSAVAETYRLYLIDAVFDVQYTLQKRKDHPEKIKERLTKRALKVKETDLFVKGREFLNIRRNGRLNGRWSAMVGSTTGLYQLLN